MTWYLISTKLKYNTSLIFNCTFFYSKNKFYMMLTHWSFWSKHVSASLKNSGLHNQYEPLLLMKSSWYKILFCISHDHCVSLHNIFLKICMKKRLSRFASATISWMNFCSIFKVSFWLIHLVIYINSDDYWLESTVSPEIW